MGPVEPAIYHGFLPTRGSFMLDFVVVGMAAILPLLGLSIYLVRQRKQYQWHKRLQIGLASTLLLTVVPFEVDLRFVTDWRALAEPSPFYQPGTWNPVWYSLIIHLCFAIPTPLLWIYVVIQALRKFPAPPTPGIHSKHHLFWARLAAGGMLMTGLTGWVFYYLAFVA